jgi:hypothetical protein
MQPEASVHCGLTGWKLPWAVTSIRGGCGDETVVSEVLNSGAFYSLRHFLRYQNEPSPELLTSPASKGRQAASSTHPASEESWALPQSCTVAPPPQHGQIVQHSDESHTAGMEIVAQTHEPFFLLLLSWGTQGLPHTKHVLYY